MNSSNQLTAEDLELINRYTIREVTADEIFGFSLCLCDNETDRHNERFATDALPALAEMFVGVTGIRNHSGNTDDQSARIYKTQVVTDPDLITSAGEPYTYIKAWAYMPRSESNAQLIEEIETGIRKETSVGCAVGAKICSVCGSPLGTCTHLSGYEYGGETCHTILCEPKDAFEWSFVAVPAQRAAGVTKSAGQLVEKHSSSTGNMAEYAHFGLECRQSLIRECSARLCRMFDGISGDDANAIFASLSPVLLQVADRALEKACLPYNASPQLCADGEKENINKEFLI